MDNEKTIISDMGYIISDISQQGASISMVSQKAFFYPSSVNTVRVDVKSSIFPGFRSGFVNTVALTKLRHQLYLFSENLCENQGLSRPK